MSSSVLPPVFVGPLSFKTREADVAKEFENAGEVTSVNIITRGPRSLGYGFVEMKTVEAAEKAVTLMNKKEIDGREINVELAKPRSEVNAAERPARRPRGSGRRGRGRGSRVGGRVGGASNGNNNNNNNNASREPSKTTLFVANLPFGIDDEGLSQLFAGFKVTKAHVVRKRNSKSKGFGFVEFESEEDQQKALDAKDKSQCEGRELSVKVALTEPPSSGDDGEDGENGQE